ncbi:flavonoid 8-hydroxylase 2, chloroplastic-like [Lycium barbarum]|uniref:flavonoid 8-hydroxylase 2, chloroplastic-like n=1 Tax=Lycium barbarum TaxID=112863 RepID=UPI00293EF31D|nr:flavonoid 8-hydroxylase 2, chloroplastic-like [Lycium barbarum]
MEALTISTCFAPFHFNLSTPRFSRIICEKPKLYFPLNQQPHKSYFSSNQPHQNARFNLFTSNISNSTISTNEPQLLQNQEEKFEWYEQWYPIMPISELDKRRPHGKKVMGIDVVVWWDKNEKQWKVMDDSCPHRSAPLSEGRIDQWGRLQCVYHGWCFGGSGDCKFIPQAPRDKPPVHTSKRACLAVYPSVVQSYILWFWPNSDPLYKDIHLTKRPPYIPLIDDTSYSSYAKSTLVRDIPYGYEILIENLMDPSHINYAHYGIMKVPELPDSVKADREGGMPFDISPAKLDFNGFTAKQGTGEHKFIAPCVYYGPFGLAIEDNLDKESSESEEQSSSDKIQRLFLVFICVPVSPGKSRLIITAVRNFAVWEHKLIPPWIFHLEVNLIIDSDLYLLHLQEHKLKEKGAHNWQKACYVPTKADALVVGFRKWLNKYGGGQVDWATKFTGDLPPTPFREQLLDRYWTHTVQCTSCSKAYKSLNALEIILQTISVASIGIAAAAKESVISIGARYFLVFFALLCFVGSRWLSKFIYKSFHYHDYDHAFR